MKETDALDRCRTASTSARRAAVAMRQYAEAVVLNLINPADASNELRGPFDQVKQGSPINSMKIKLGRTLALALVEVFAFTCTLVRAEPCPALLRDAQRLILVIAPTMNTVAAAAGLFERDLAESPWRVIHHAEPVALGRSGMGWGPTFRELARDHEPFKVEGDMRTPAGFYRTGRTFGFVPSQRVNYLQIKAGDTVCVSDPSSPAYNTITSRALVARDIDVENMGSTELYRRGLTIDYPTDRAAAAGSCIFIHVWRARDKGTAGCVGMPESLVAASQDFAEHGAVIAILPESALARFKECLPDVSHHK